MKDRLNFIVNIVILTAVGLLLVGPSGPVGRTIARSYDAWKDRQRIEAAWSDMVDTPAILGADGVAESNASIIVEFVDYACPSCRQLSHAVSAVASSGRAKIAIRHFPLSDLHPNAYAAAAAAVCATAQGSFAEIHALLLADDAWIENPDWSALARRASVRDIGDFEQCMQQPETNERIEEDIQMGRTLQVAGTPAFVARSGIFVGTAGLAEALASLPTKQRTARKDVAPRSLRIGEADVFDSSLHWDTAVAELGQLAAAMFVDAQRLMMADRMNAEIHLVDLPTGDLRTIGRQGDGPGEFRLLMDAVRTSDGFATWDPQQARITMFSATGELTNSWAYSFLWFNKPIASPVAVLSDGVVIFRDGDVPGDPHGRYREKVRYLAVTKDGVAGVVAEADGPEYWGHGGGTQAVVLGHLLLEAQLGDRIAIAQTDRGKVRMVDRDGETAGELSLAQGKEASAKQVEMAREHARERLRRRMARRSGGPAGEAFRQSAKVKLENVANVAANRTAPAIDKLFVDFDGRLWLRAYAMPDDGDARWQVWEPDDLTEARFVVVGQSTLELLDAAGSHVLLHERDAMGVDRVFVAALAEGD